MIIVLDAESLLYLFDSIDEIVSEFEAIDIENGEYEFCDESGQRYEGRITSPVKTFKAGAFVLKPIGEPDADIPISFVERASSLDRACQGIKSLDEVKEFLTSGSS